MARLLKFNLRLQSLVLLVLIPGLLLSTALFGWSTYRVLYGMIMTGFDQKLYAVSTVTGSFISGEEHDALYDARSFRAVTAGIAPEEVIGLEEGGSLYAIDLEQGGALEVVALPTAAVAVAVDPGSRTVWAATEDSALHTVDIATGEPSTIGALAFLPDGMAYSPLLGLLYAGGERLTVIDPRTAEIRPVTIQGLTGPVRAPAMDRTNSTLYVLAGVPEELVAVDLLTGRARAVGAPHDPTLEDAEAPARPVPAPRLIDLAMSPTGGLVGVADRLVRIDTTTAAVDSAGTAMAFRSSRHPAYQRYVEPMRRIMARNDITYLYTEKVELGGRLTYGIDGTTGEDHSVIGTTEMIADEDVPAMERAIVEGIVRLSDLEEWEAWGLLKTADAPIYREDGSIAALAAADVDISVILEKTRVAMVQVGLIAVLTLLVGVGVSLGISKRLVSPLNEVKEGALQLAAGSYGHRIADQRLVELGELSQSFNRMSEALGTTLGELSKTNKALENVRSRRALEVTLADPGYRPDPGPPFLVEQTEARDGGSHDPSGYVHVGGEGGGMLLVWLAESPNTSPIETLRLRREIATLVRATMARHGQDWRAAAEFVSRLFPQIQALVLLDAAGRSVEVDGSHPVELAVVGADAAIRQVELLAGGALELAPKEWLVVATRDPLAAIETVRRDRLETVGDLFMVHGARRQHGQVGRSQLAIALFGRDLLIDESKAAPRKLAVPLAGVVG